MKTGSLMSTMDNGFLGASMEYDGMVVDLVMICHVFLFFF